MNKRDPKFDNYVIRIHEVLDRLDYYKLLGVAHDAGVSDIRNAFLTIAAKFHPDRNRDADKTVEEALYDIFKRLNEAYRVLCDQDRRKLYNETLAQGKVRLDQDIRKASVPKKPIDTIRSRKAREFYQQAEDALETGDLMKADLHIKLAKSQGKGNKAIQELADKIAEGKKNKKKNKKKK